MEVLPVKRALTITLNSTCKMNCAIFRQLGDPMMTSHGLSELGRILLISGELSEAEKLLWESFELAQELDCRFGMGLALDVLGQVAYTRSAMKMLGHFSPKAPVYLRKLEILIACRRL